MSTAHEEPLFKPVCFQTAPRQRAFDLKLYVLAGPPPSGGGSNTLSFGFPGLMSLFLALWSVLA